MDPLRHGLLNIALKWGQGVGRQGEAYGWLIDCRELLLQGDYLSQASQLLWQRLKPYHPDSVAGMTLAAHPLALGLKYAAQAEGIDLSVNLIRRTPKEDGLQRQVEGPPPRAGQRVVLVDDLINSGETQRKALMALRKFGVEVAAVGVLIDYQRGGSQWLRRQGLSVEALYSLSELGIGEIPSPPLDPEWIFEGLNSGQYSAPKSSACLAPDRLWIGSDQGFLLCLDRRGKELWRFAVRDRQRGIHGTPLHRNGRIYVGAYDGFLYCVEGETGKLVWEKACAQWIGSSPIGDKDRLYVGVEFGELGGALLALDPHDGTSIWESRAGHYVHSTPCLAPGKVIFAANDGVVRCLESSGGRPLWSFYSHGPVQGSLSSDQDFCYVASGDGLLYALDLERGRVAWQRRLSRQLYCRPLLCHEQVVVAGDGGSLVAVNRRTGEVEWVAGLGSPLVGGAALTDWGEIWAGTQSGAIRSFDLQGRPRGQYAAGAPIRTTPACDRQSLVVADNGGRLYSFAAPG